MKTLVLLLQTAGNTGSVEKLDNALAVSQGQGTDCITGPGHQLYHGARALTVSQGQGTNCITGPGGKGWAHWWIKAHEVSALGTKTPSLHKPIVQKGCCTL